MGGPHVGDFVAEEEAVQLDPDIPKMRYHGELQGTGEDLEVFRTQRFTRGRDLVLNFPVPDGIYTVTLLFAETWNGAFQRGVRTFDVYLGSNPNGVVKVIPSLDMFAVAGGASPIRRPFTGIVAKGGIKVALRPVKQNPQIAGVIIEGHTFQDTNLSDIPNAPMSPNDQIPDLAAVSRVGSQVPTDPSLLYNPELDPKNRPRDTTAAPNFGSQTPANGQDLLSLSNAASPGSDFPSGGYASSLLPEDHSGASSAFAQSTEFSTGVAVPSQVGEGGHAASGAGDLSTRSAKPYGTENSNLGGATGFGSPVSVAQALNGAPAQALGAFGGQASAGNPPLTSDEYNIQTSSGFDQGSTAGSGLLNANRISNADVTGGHSGVQGFAQHNVPGFGVNNAMGAGSSGGRVPGDYGATTADKSGLRASTAAFTASGYNSQPVASSYQALMQGAGPGALQLGFEVQSPQFHGVHVPRRRLLQLQDATASQAQTSLMHRIRFLNHQRELEGRGSSSEVDVSAFGRDSRDQSSPPNTNIRLQDGSGVYGGFGGLPRSQDIAGSALVGAMTDGYGTAMHMSGSSAQEHAPFQPQSVESVSSHISPLQLASYPRPERLGLDRRQAAFQNENLPRQASLAGTSEDRNRYAELSKLDGSFLTNGRAPGESKFDAASDYESRYDAASPDVDRSRSIPGSRQFRGEPSEAIAPVLGSSAQGYFSQSSLTGRSEAVAEGQSRQTGGVNGAGDSPRDQRVLGFPPGVSDIPGLGEERPPRHPGIDDPLGRLDRLCVNNGTHCSCGMSIAEPDSECLFVLSEASEPKLCRRDRCNARFLCGCAPESGMLCERKVARTILVQAQTNERMVTAHPNVVLCVRKTVETDIPVLEPVLGHLR
jgi:hypothetical protein